MRAASLRSVDNTKETAGSLRPVRLQQSTFQKLTDLLAKVNQKEGGKRVRADDVILLALSMVSDSHIVQLRDKSLTNADRVDKAYRDYVVQKGVISKDAFLGLLLDGKTSIQKMSSRA